MRKKLRVVNAILWAWLWLSAALSPVTSGGADFWSEKRAQLFSLNPHFDDIPRLIGNGLGAFLIWLLLDWVIRPRVKKTTPDQRVGL
jgi:hypothetical protein